MNNSSSGSIHRGLHHFVAAGRPLIMVQTFEEDRLGGILATLAESFKKELWTWHVNAGLVTSDGPVSETQTAAKALAYLQTVSSHPFVWFKDLHHHYSPQVIRGMRDLYQRWRGQGGVAVVSAIQRAIPADLEREIAFLTLEMPSQDELKREVERWLEETGTDMPLPAEAIATMLKGLTLAEVQHSLARVRNERSAETDPIAVLQEEKRQLIQKTGTLSYIPKVPAIEQVGGLDNLKDWLLKRKQLLLSSDDASREIVPKGILLMGVSGCGKSLCIKAISSGWQLPLYRMEMVNIFSGAFGSPEMAFADACHVMEQMAPAVLWIDEIEMSLSAEGSNAADSVLSRIFAFFLTWMQEKPPGLFVAATANRIDLLPAEMIRKGRFDQVFFVDIPTLKERKQIFAIHLAKRGYDPANFTLDAFADATGGWNGAEIEQCVIAAITNARMEDRDLELKDLYGSRKQIVPISTTMEEQVRHIRNWAYERAVRASAES